MPEVDYYTSRTSNSDYIAEDRVYVTKDQAYVAEDRAYIPKEAEEAMKTDETEAGRGEARPQYYRTVIFMFICPSVSSSVRLSTVS